MLEKNINIIDFNHKNIRLYFFGIMFTFGNVLLPILFHIFSLGGNIFLPIYFFTLVGAYKFGWKTGVVICFLTPILNYYFTGMPVLMIIPVVIFKGLALVILASILAKSTQKISISNLIIAVLGYQIIGGIFQAVWLMDFIGAISSIIIAWPGMLLQIFGGYAIISGIRHYE